MAPYPSFPLHLPRGLSDPNSPIARDPHGKTVKTWLGDVNSSSNSPTMRASSPTTPDALLSTSNFFILCSLRGKVYSFRFLVKEPKISSFFVHVRPSVHLLTSISEEIELEKRFSSLCLSPSVKSLCFDDESSKEERSMALPPSAH